MSAPFLVPAQPRVSMSMEIWISTPTINIDCAPYFVWWPLEPFPVREIGKARCNHHLLLGCTPKHAARREYGLKPSVDATRTRRSALAQRRRRGRRRRLFVFMSRQRYVQSMTCLSEQGNHIIVFQGHNPAQEHGIYLLLMYLKASTQVLLTTTTADTAASMYATAAR